MKLDAICDRKCPTSNKAFKTKISTFVFLKPSFSNLFSSPA